MRAVQFATTGGPEVLEVVEVPVPRSGPGEIVVQVASAGINPLDTKIRAGAPMGPTAASLPSGTGVDAAGIVVEVGAGIEDVRVGDRVFGTGRATVAELAVLTQWATLPPSVDIVQAGGWGVAVETAHRLLTELGVAAGTILLSGASGGVGSALIQLARTRGLTVIGTASEPNHPYLETLGAIPVAYGHGLVERVRAVAPGGIDGALDLSGAGVIADLVEVVGDAAKVVSISDFSAPRHGARISTGATRTTRPRDGFAEALALDGFAIRIQQRYAMDEAADAHRQVESGHTVGKLLVVP